MQLSLYHKLTYASLIVAGGYGGGYGGGGYGGGDRYGDRGKHVDRRLSM